MKPRPSFLRDLRTLSAAGLTTFLEASLSSLLEEEAVAILENPHCTVAISQTIAQSQRLSGFYAVRVRLVACRSTPLGHAMKLVHYLYWPDLVRLSVDVKVPPAVRRAVDNLLLPRVAKLTTGERVAVAKACSYALIRPFLFDTEACVFESVLLNPRLREDELLWLVDSRDASAGQLLLIAADRKWSARYSIRRALAGNPLTPRATAASQLRHLRLHDLYTLRKQPETSVYLQRCIDRLLGRGGRSPSDEVGRGTAPIPPSVKCGS